MTWLVRLGVAAAIAAAWTGLAAVVWTALRDLREEARCERELTPRRRS